MVTLAPETPFVIDTDMRVEFEKFLMGVKGSQAEGRVHKAMVFRETLEVFSQDDLEGIELGLMLGVDGQPIKSGVESFIRKAIDKATRFASQSMPGVNSDGYSLRAPPTPVQRSGFSFGAAPSDTWWCAIVPDTTACLDIW